MINSLILFSIRNKLIIGLSTVALIAVGIWSAIKIPLDAVPDITNNQVQVITSAPSLAAQEVERLITFPIELTMATIPDIDEVRSFSRFGLSVVTIVFEEDIDIYWARQQVNERLTKAKSQIPTGIGNPEMAPVTTGLGEIYQYVVHTKPGYEDRYTAMELRTIQDWIIKRQLLGTPGVADVSSFGGYLKQYEIAINPDKLHSMNISLSEVFSALQKNNQNTGGAYIDKKPNAYFIRTEGLVGTLDDIKKVVVKRTEDGIPVLIGDVSEVRYGNAVRYGATTRNGEGEVVSSIVMMLKGANSAKVIADVKTKINQIKKTLPEGVVIEPFLDRTKLVDNAIGTVSTNLIEGALIVIFILILFLGNVRAGLVVASVIPLAMLFAFFMMNLFGVSGNLMSLGAIDFGLIVDGTVIIVESILLRITVNSGKFAGLERLNREQMDEQVFEASSKIRNSAAFGEIIILIVYLPILALVGVEGKMFKPMAQTVSFAILGAFILSLTYVPMMSALCLSRKTKHKRNISDRMMAFFHKMYVPIISRVLNIKGIVVLVSFGLFVYSMFVFSKMGGEFIPTLDEGDFAVETRVMTGSSLTETVDAATKAEKILLDNFPEVLQVVGKIGSGEIPTDPMPVEACDLMIILKDKSEWTSASTREELAEKMGKKLENIPGVTFGFQQPIQMRFNELMTGARQDVVIKVYGEDLNSLSNYAKQIGKLLKTVQGAEDLYVEQVTGLPQIQVIYNRDLIAKYALNIDDVNNTIETAFAGKTTGYVYEGQRKFDMVVRFDKAHRASIEDVSRLFVATNDGQQIPLNQIAEVSFKDGPNQIQRDDTKRRITVGFNVRNRDVESVVEEIKAKIERDIVFEPGYYPTYGGQFQNLVEARQRLSIAVPIALLLILVLLYFTFKSMKQAILIFTAIPLSAIGGIFALYLRDMPFSISAGVGFIALFGVAVLNGIVLISEFNYLKKNGITDIKERIIKGTEERLRPVLMTAMVASCGFLPMALSNSSGAEVQRPLATVVIGGLITATFLTLVVLPTLYVYFENGFKKLPRVNKIVPIILIMMTPVVGYTQSDTDQVTLDQAINLAIKNNLTMRSTELDVELSKQHKKTAVDIGKTQLNWQHGQYNSINNNDNYFEVSQSFAFPTYYFRSSQVANVEIKSRELKKRVTQNELIAEVKSVYRNLQFYYSIKEVYLELDSLYSDFLKAAELRYKTGETTFLEKVSAETQLMNIKNKLRMLGYDYEKYKTQLGTLLNSKISIDITQDESKKMTWDIANDSLSVDENPKLVYLQQQVILFEKQEGVEKAKILPDITVAYFNQSLIGNQTINGTDQYFAGNDRFTGFQVGLSIPLWFKPAAARVEMAKVRTEIIETDFKLNKIQQEGLFKQAIQEYFKQKNGLEYYENNALTQSELMIKNAVIAYKNGAIGYVEYVQLIQQGSQIKLNWLETLNNYNQSIIQLEYLVGIK